MALPAFRQTLYCYLTMRALIDKKSTFYLLILCSLGVLASLQNIYILKRISFDGLYGQDPYAYYGFSEQLIHFLKGGSFPEPFFWPWGYPTLLALGKSLGLAAISVNIILFAVVPGIIFLIAKELHLSIFSGLVAAVSIAVSGQMLQSSLLIMSDIPAVFWCLLSLLFILKYQNKNLFRYLLLSLIFLAFAAITRWLYLLMIIPWGFFLLSKRVPPKEIFKSALLPGIVIIGQILLGKSDKFNAFQHHFFDNWSFNNFSNHALKGFEGVTSVAAPNFSFYSDAITDPFWLPQVLLPFVILGLGFLIWSKNIPTLCIVLPWILVPYLFFCGLPVQNPRYSLMFFPAISLLVGLGAESVYKALSKKVIAGILMLGIGLIGALSNIKSNPDKIIAFLEVLNRDKETAVWISSNIDNTGTIYAFGITLTLKHYHPKLKTLELFFENPTSLAEKTKSNQPNYLVLDTNVIAEQWTNTPLAKSYAWLNNTPGLTLIGTRYNYSLFRINE